MVVERVHLGQEEQRAVVPQLQEVNQPEDERYPGDDKKPDESWGLTIGGRRFAVHAHQESIFKREVRSSRSTF
jgi:hypothetical protein